MVLYTYKPASPITYLGAGAVAHALPMCAEFPLSQFALSLEFGEFCLLGEDLLFASLKRGGHCGREDSTTL